MINNDKIVPNDLEDAISIEELTNYIADIIIRIRKEDTSLSVIIKKINELAQYANLTKDDEVSQLFHAYKKIQEVSMELRRILSTFLNIEVYNAIDYAFYYNGRLYHTEEIKEEWLTKSGTSGELKIRLNAATKDL